MAITAQLITDAKQKLIIKVHVDGTTDYTDAVLVDASTLSPVPVSLKLTFAQILSIGCNAILNHDGAANAHLLTVPEGEVVVDYSKTGGVPNNATTPTGDLLISTAGLAAGDNMTFYLEFDKVLS